MKRCNYCGKNIKGNGAYFCGGHSRAIGAWLDAEGKRAVELWLERGKHLIEISRGIKKYDQEV